MKSLRLPKSLFAAALSLLFSSALVADVWVATTGSDDTGTGLRDNPYLTIGKALSTLGDDGGTIWLENGEYGVTATVELTTPVTIRSVSGSPEDVTVRRTSGDISVVKLNCATARLLDVTVAYGGTKTPAEASSSTA